MARSFNGSSDTAVTTKVSQLQTGSIGGWINPAAIPAATHVSAPFTFNESGSTTTYDKTVFITPTGVMGYIFSGAGVEAPITVTLTTGVWFHFVLTFDGTTVTPYYNGAAGTGVAAGNSFTGYTTPVNSCALAVSSPPGFSFVDHFSGKLADWFTSNSALAPEQILTLASGGRPWYIIRPYTLQGYWQFDGINSPELDYSGFFNFFTLTGTSYADDPPQLMRPTPEWFDRAIELPAASAVVFRRTLSQFGTRVGSRQVHFG